MVTVVKSDGTVRAVIIPDESSQMERGLMGQDVVTVGLSAPVPIPFTIGDSATFFGLKYWLNSTPTVTMTAKRNYQYRLVFEGKAYDLSKTQYLFLDPFNNFKDGKFILTTTAQGFLDLIVYNLKRRDPSSNWKVGYVEQTDVKTLEFDSNNCLEVLARLAQEFETEYYITKETISLYKKQDYSGIVLKYGINEALYSIVRENQDSDNVITRLYAYGSDKNLGTQYRSGAQRLRMTNGVYVEKLTETYGINEATKIFEDIFPQRTGTITSVTSPLVFSDAAMDFDVNDYLIASTTAKLVFKTGLNAGYEVDISNYNNATKTFTVLVSQEEQTKTVPSAVWTPKVGDKYTLVDIKMPPSYVLEAENKLESAANSHLDDVSTPKLSYKVTLNPLWAKRNLTELNLGQTVGLEAVELGINTQIRCINIVRNIRNPNIINIELANTVVQTKLVKLINSI